MPHVMVDSIDGHVMLISHDQKGQDPFCFSFWHGADIQQSFIHDEAIVYAEESVPFLGIHVVTQVFSQ